MARPRTQLAGLAAVLATMSPMFLLPRSLFVPAVLLATSCMTAAALSSGGYRRLFAPRPWKLALALASAAALYLVFVAGNAAVTSMHPLGLDVSSENSIYDLIASPSNPPPVQLAVLVFDSIGYESYFRGTLQTRLEGRLGPYAALAVALGDALVHVLSFNLLWVVTTFVVDAFWGLTYHFTRDLTSSMTSHLAWDVAIFVIAPVR